MAFGKSDNSGKSKLCEELVLQYRNMSNYLPIELQLDPQDFKPRNGSAHLQLVISGLVGPHSP
jgi:hypothetical protein